MVRSRGLQIDKNKLKDGLQERKKSRRDGGRMLRKGSM